MFDNPGTSIALAAVSVLLLGSGIGISFLLGRRAGRAAAEKQKPDDDQVPDHVVREIIRCLELGDYVARDAETLSNVVAAQPVSVPRPVNSALQQFIKTAKSLVGRLHRMGASARIARPVSAAVSGALSSSASASSGASSFTPAPPAAPKPQPKCQIEVPASANPEDSRRFPRSEFRGTAWATIYPQHPTSGREPKRCEVMTRDLSCGGVGIAHTEPLFPKQIIVLDAVGKLLVSEVRWCRRVDENYYVAGCRLVKTGG